MPQLSDEDLLWRMKMWEEMNRAKGAGVQNFDPMVIEATAQQAAPPPSPHWQVEVGRPVIQTPQQNFLDSMPRVSDVGQLSPYTLNFAGDTPPVEMRMNGLANRMARRKMRPQVNPLDDMRSFLNRL